ncbi:Protein of unknown function [Bacillus cereus]|nr:Protein of unknown function [Bacillus cereus]
MEADGFLP